VRDLGIDGRVIHSYIGSKGTDLDSSGSGQDLMTGVE